MSENELAIVFVLTFLTLFIAGLAVVLDYIKKVG